MFRHSLPTAVISPVPMARNAMPCASTPLVFVKLGSRVVSAVGMSSEAAQHEAIVTAVARVRPNWAACPLSQAAAQMPPRIRPGSTNGTRRRLAHG